MQEAAISLMQLAKTSSKLAQFAKHKLPFISLLTDPTTGGVTASYGMLGDVNIAEPKALIAFAGPRVVEQTIHKKLPPGFQRSEFLLEHGIVTTGVQQTKTKTALEYFAGELRSLDEDEEETPSTDDHRDVERSYSAADTVAKLRRLADAIEKEKPFRIQIAGERIKVPDHARFSIDGSDFPLLRALYEVIGEDKSLTIPWNAMFGGAPTAPDTGRAEQTSDDERAAALAHEPD